MWKAIFNISIGFFVLSACSYNDPERQGTDVSIDRPGNSSSPESVDSTLQYSFFLGLETTNFNSEEGKDSTVIFRGKYGLPESIEIWYKGGYMDGKLCSKKEYEYNIKDSTETIRSIHDTGGLAGSEVRRFDHNRRCIKLTETDINRDKRITYYHYTPDGSPFSAVIINGNHGDTIDVKKY